MKHALNQGIFALCLLAFAGGTSAQSLVGTSPSAPLVPSSLRAASAASPFALPGGTALSPSLFQWGPIGIKPHVSERFVYSDGIPWTQGRTANTYINSLSAGVFMDIGSHWTLDYTPTWVIYTNRLFNNSVDEALSLAGGVELGDWLVQFGQSYSSSNSPQIETSTQVGQESSTTNLNVSHRFNDHWSIELGGAQSLQFIEKSPDYYDWSSQDWLVYHAGTRLELSAGYRVGYTDFDPGAYMTYSQPSARIRWRISDKITLSAEGGEETREVHKTGFSKQTTPSYSGSFEYQPFEQTFLTFKADQSVAPSRVSNSLTKGKGWSVDLQQRLLGHFTLRTGLSQRNSHYVGSHQEYNADYTFEDILDEDGNVIGTLTNVTYTPFTVADIRNDTTRSYHINLSTPFLGRGTVSVLYEYTRNKSDQAGFNFSSHQVGFEFGYRW